MKRFVLFSFILLFVFNSIILQKLCLADNCLHNNERLFPGYCLTSTSTMYKFCYQSDGNACISNSNGPTWCLANVVLTQYPDRFALESDGNIAAYGYDPIVHNLVSYWQTNSAYSDSNQAVSQYLIMQDDGNLVLYPSSGAYHWACYFHTPSCPLTTVPNPSTNQICNNNFFVSSQAPTKFPTFSPTLDPTNAPTCVPTMAPTRIPTSQPTSQPSRQPTSLPSAQPRSVPTVQPTSQPSRQPSPRPSSQPSSFPSSRPTSQPTHSPTRQPTVRPSTQPSRFPTGQPSRFPSSQPTHFPTKQPTSRPSSQPSRVPSSQPSRLPSRQPSSQPSRFPSAQPSHCPSRQPTGIPSSVPSTQPTVVPSCQPICVPSSLPTGRPSSQPTEQPSRLPTLQPSSIPTSFPTEQPSTVPSNQPTSVPSSQPSSQPTALPSGFPSSFPSSQPSIVPSSQPTSLPSSQPSVQPTAQPSSFPSAFPTTQPSSYPTAQPTSFPTDQPSNQPTSQPTTLPTTQPSHQPTSQPTGLPSSQPTIQPSSQPTGLPTVQPTEQPTSQPSALPSSQPTSLPTDLPSSQPTSFPSTQPSIHPSTQPSSSPTVQPSTQPSIQPTVIPTDQPSSAPSSSPSSKPSTQPSTLPSNQPSDSPSSIPSTQPSTSPSCQPSTHPSLQPSSSPSSVPTRFPSTSPTTQPTAKPSPVPLMIVDSYFTSNGAAVIIKLSNACPTLFTQETFPCTNYFEFACVNTSVCQWKDSRTIDASVPAMDKCIRPGDALKVTTLPVANPLCQFLNEKNCLDLPWDVRQTKVNFAVNPVVPKVSFNLPELLSYCSALHFDLSNSVGNLGRPWESIHVSVRTDKGSNLVPLDLERFIQTKFSVQDPQLAPPLQISSSYFAVNTEYSFTVQLCNFLAACHQDLFSIKVIPHHFPPVTILRVTPAEMTRSQPLSLRASVQRTNCNETIGLNDLQFNWTITRKSKLNGLDILEDSIKSSSRDRSRFTLSPNTLQSNETYFISLRMAYLGSSSVTSVPVKVLTGKLVAVITGNDQQSMRVGELYSLDGRQSYDEDNNKENTAVPSTVFKFLWSCERISSFSSGSSSSTSCLQIFRSSLFLPSIHSSSLRLIANESSTITTVRISLTVSDLSTGRTAVTAITMSILPQLYPVISLSTTASVNKLNPGESLQITANISLPSVGLSGNISWQSIPSLSLNSITATPISQSFSPNVNSKFVLFYLAILPNSLLAGLQYSFGLRCQLNENIVATNYISITVNAPPSSGSFLVDPPSGTAFIDVFQFTCNNWIDSDLPLSYQFSYRSPTGINLITKSVTPLSYSTSVLPEGVKNENNQNEIICVGDVFDSLNANTTTFNSVQVNSLLSVNVSGLVSTILNPMNAIDLDDLLLGVNLASSLLNQPNCSLAPNCSSLNRLPCISTGHTCGSCKAFYVSSITGGGNEKCLRGDSSIATTKNKECYLNCSYRGHCIYYSQTTGKRIETCFEGDLSCYSSCSCQDGYKMSQYCEILDEETESYLKLRELVVGTILTNSGFQDRSEQVISGWMNSLLTVAQVPNQVSEKSLTSLLDLTELALHVVQSEGYSLTITLSTYLDGLDNLATVIPVLRTVVSRLSRKRKLELQQASFNERIDQNLKDYSNIILNSLVPGQSAVQTVKSNFKLHLQTLALSSKNNPSRRKLSSTSVAEECTQTASFTFAQSPLEKALKQPQTTLIVPTCAANPATSSLQVGIVALSSSLYSNQEKNFTSNPVSLSLSTHVCLNDKECGVLFTMESHNQGARRLVHPAENRSVDCVTNDFTNHTVFCSTGDMNKNYTGHCRGINERITIQCPSVSLFPTCNALTGNTLSDIGCKTKSFDSNSITCFCPLDADSGSSSSSSDSTDITVVAFLDNVGDNFVHTIVSAQDLNAETLAQSPEAVITIVLFLGCILVFMLFSVYADGQTKKRISTEEKVMEHAKVYSLYQHKLEAQSKNPQNENTEKEINLFQLVETALPDILNSPSLNERIWKEEKKFHRYLGIVYYFSALFPRVLRVVSLASNIIIMLFIQSLTYNYTHGDDGSCKPFTTEGTCLEPKSYYGTGKNKCYWKENDKTKCQFIEPENSIEIILFVAVFSGLVSAPLAVLVDWIILHILSAPDTNELRVQNLNGEGEKAFMKDKNVSILPVNERINDESKEKQFSFRITSTAIEKYSQLVENDYQNLLKELLYYRNTISRNEQHRQELDRLWVLKGENPQLYWEVEKTDKEYTIGRLFQRLGALISSTLVDKQSVSKSLHQELYTLYSSLEKERIKFEVLKSETAKSKRLLYLFQKDLLPGINGEILETKSSRDHIILSPASPRKKILAWSFLLFLDLGMLFYVFLFAISQDSHRQLAWGRSLGMYLLLDIVFISTFMVIFMHVLLPSMIMRDIGKIKEKVRGNIQSFYEKKLNEAKEDDEKSQVEGERSLHLKKRGRNKNTTSLVKDKHSEMNCVSFNSVKYLFLSFRLAELFPELPASQIILQYSSPWPKQSYAHVHDVKSNYSDRYTAIYRAISIVVIFLLTNLLATPAAIQDMILQMITLVMMGYLLLVHIQLYYIFPVLVIIPTVVVIAGVYLIYHYFFRSVHIEEVNTDNKSNNFVHDTAVNNNPQTIITTRRQSLQQGTQLASQLQENLSHDSGDQEGSWNLSDLASSNRLSALSEEYSDSGEDDKNFDLLDSLSMKYDNEIPEMESPVRKINYPTDTEDHFVHQDEAGSNERKSEEEEQEHGDSDVLENEHEYKFKTVQAHEEDEEQEKIEYFTDNQEEEY
jgi:hypothetical protein